jgi:hypothetical protein
LLNATTARPFAKLVGVFLKKSEGILIVGSSMVSRLIARYLQRNNRHVVLIDNNQTNIQKAKKLGLEALTADIYSDTLMDNIELNDVGYLIAMTANSDINKFAIEKFRDQFGENGSFRILDSDEVGDPEVEARQELFSQTNDFVRLMEASRKYPAIHEIPLKNEAHLKELMNTMLSEEDIAPLFIKSPDGELHIIPAFSRSGETAGKGYKLVYLGKKVGPDLEGDEVVSLPRQEEL